MEDNQTVEPKVTTYLDEPAKQEVVNPAPTVPQKGKKKEKTPKSGILKAATAVFIISIITGVGALFCVASPILFGLLIVLYLCVVLMLTICSLGLLWLEESNRQGVGEVYNWIMSLSNYVTALLATGMVMAIIAIVTTIASVVLSSIAVSKKHKGAVPILVISSIILVIVIVLVVVALYNISQQN